MLALAGNFFCFFLMLARKELNMNHERVTEKEKERRVWTGGSSDLCCDLSGRGWAISIGVVFPLHSCETEQVSNAVLFIYHFSHHIFTFLSISISNHPNLNVLFSETAYMLLWMCLQFSPGCGRLALQVCGRVIEGQQHLYSGQLGGGGGCGAAVVIQRHTGHCATALTLGGQQEGSTTWILRWRLRESSIKKTLTLTFQIVLW